MRKSILFLLFIPALTLAQDFNTALSMHNTVRGYYNLSPLNIDDDLTDIAYERARKLADQDDLIFTNDGLGESAFFTDYITISRDYFLEATLAFILEDYNNASLKQVLCEDCKKVGYGIAVTDDKVWVVVKYDKVYKK